MVHVMNHKHVQVQPHISYKCMYLCFDLRPNINTFNGKFYHAYDVIIIFFLYIYNYLDVNM